MFLFCSCFFFFQAEDGIRDGRVTGVQTCALPILVALADVVALLPGGPGDRQPRALRVLAHGDAELADGPRGAVGALPRAHWRSEERRVGKEGRSRVAQDSEEK